MCGRFAFFSPREAILEAFGLDFEPAGGPRYNISPTQAVSVIHLDKAGSIVSDTCRWGLVPFWAKDPAIGSRMINARAETLADKPAYRQAFARRRCLVLASGFYEWHTDESGKWPWFISRRDGDVFAMAGLWETWGKGKREDLRSCAVITAPANDFMQRLHHRMPVIMSRENMHEWLKQDAPADDLKQMLLGEQSAELQAWRVDRKVNNPVNEGAELIEEYAD
jgi:putative SOS response-associated peptidase YedK